MNETRRACLRNRASATLHPRLTAAVRACGQSTQEHAAMAGNRPDLARNASPRPDRGPPGAPRGDDNPSGYDEPKATTLPRETRAEPDPTVPGNRGAQAGIAPQPPPQDPDDPHVDQPVPPGDVPSKTPVKEPERGEAQYVADAADAPVYSDAARPVVPGPADGAD
jgi:hypothetical protein